MRLQAAAERLPLSAPFRISRGVKDAADVVVVTLERGGVIGRGEAVPYPRYGETTESVLAQIEQARTAVEAGTTRLSLFGLLPAGAARNAVDCALWDLEAREDGTSVDAISSIKTPDRLVTAVTVSLDTPDRMARAAEAIGYAPLIKVKVDATDPEAQIRAVRAAVPNAALIVDPNESWDLPLLTRLQPMLAEMKIALLEQPLPAGADSALRDLDRLVPICADESCHVAEDLDALIGLYSHVNIKLDKTGGLTAALDLLSAARAKGFGVMTGCMICSSLSIAPAWTIAARSDFADLDGPLWLKDDREGGFVGDRGWLCAPAPGFWGQA